MKPYYVFFVCLTGNIRFRKLGNGDYRMGNVRQTDIELRKAALCTVVKVCASNIVMKIIQVARIVF